MRRLWVVPVALTLLAGLVAGAAIDGKWVSEQKTNRNGQERTVVTTFHLKADGTVLTGTATTGAGKKARAVPVASGRIDGNRFSFLVVRLTKKGENKAKYEGGVEGDWLKGNVLREGKKGRGKPFEARRQS
jgi:hypothetical protein